MTRPSYPPAKRLSLAEDVAGHRIPDPYRWLEDPGSDETRAWSAAQDALFQAHRHGWAARAYFRRQLSGLVTAGSVCPPLWRGRRHFVLRQHAGQDRPALVVVEADGYERILIDPCVIDPSGKTALDAWRPSWEGDLLAYQLSEGGSEQSTLWVMDVARGHVVDGPVALARCSPIAWRAGGEGFYYVNQPDRGIGSGARRVWFHWVGVDPCDDACVFGDGYEPGSHFGLSVSSDGRWLTISVAPGAVPRNDLWLADLSRSDPQRPDLRLVHQGLRTGAQASLTFASGRIYALTDRNAPNGQICALDPRDPWSGEWRQLVQEEHDAVLHDCAVLDGPELDAPLLLVARTRHAVSELTLHDPATGARVGNVSLPGVGSVQGIRQRPGGGHEVWFISSGFTSLPAVYRFDARDGQLSRWAGTPGELPAGEPAEADMCTRQVVFDAKDGTALRMFLITADQAPARPRPAILFVYGGFGASLLPVYSPMAVAWVQAGGVYAVASVRGGGEEGARWHQAGRGRGKQTTFDDVHAAAQWLVQHGWTSHDQLVLWGGSHGGLVVGAVMTQHPEACAAVVCSNPVLDMVRYEQFGVGHLWSEEFGTASDPEQLEWLLSYSPYHRVREHVDYPATLFTCPDVDPRVGTMHVRKMAAALQHATAGTRPVLIRREPDVGHRLGPASSTLELWTDMLAFAAACTGLDPAQARLRRATSPVPGESLQAPPG